MVTFSPNASNKNVYSKKNKKNLYKLSNLTKLKNPDVNNYVNISNCQSRLDNFACNKIIQENSQRKIEEMLPPKNFISNCQSKSDKFACNKSSQENIQRKIEEMLLPKNLIPVKNINFKLIEGKKESTEEKEDSVNPNLVLMMQDLSLFNVEILSDNDFLFSEAEYMSLVTDHNPILSETTNIWTMPNMLIFSILLACVHIKKLESGVNLWPTFFTLQMLGTNFDWFTFSFDFSKIFISNPPYDIIPLVLLAQYYLFYKYNSRAIFVLPLFKSNWLRWAKKRNDIAIVELQENFDHTRPCLIQLTRMSGRDVLFSKRSVTSRHGMKGLEVLKCSRTGRCKIITRE